MRMLEYLKGLFSSLARVMTPKSRPRAPKPETKAPAAGARLKNKGPEARPGDRSGDRAGQDKGPKKKLKKKVGPQAAATQAGPKGPEKQAPEPGATGQPGPAQAQPQPAPPQAAPKGPEKQAAPKKRFGLFKKKEKPPKKQKAKPGATGQAGPMQAPAGPNIELKVKKNKPAPKKAFAPQAVAKDLDVKVVKKKVAAKPAPVDQEIGEAGDGFSVSLKTVDKQHAKRKAFRIKAPGMKAYCAALGGLRPVLDISALGVGLDYRGVRIPGGTPLKLNITVGSQPIATDVRVKVMRHEKGLLGCQFVDLTRSQEDGISKTILLAQKRQASFRKK